MIWCNLYSFRETWLGVCFVTYHKIRFLRWTGIILKKNFLGTFLVVLVVKTSFSNAGCVGSIPPQGAKIPQALWPKNQNIKQKQYCNKFSKKTFLNNRISCSCTALNDLHIPKREIRAHFILVESMTLNFSCAAKFSSQVFGHYILCFFIHFIHN